MASAWLKKSKGIVVSLRFSILAIFVSLFTLSMLVLIAVGHLRFLRSMEDLSYRLMQQASLTAYNEIHNEIKSAEIIGQSAARLIKFGVVNIKNEKELSLYTSNLVNNEVNLYPSIQGISWSDTHGNFVLSEKENNGAITLNLINRSKKPFYYKRIRLDAQGKPSHSETFNGTRYDPRTRPWYQKAKTSKKLSWMDIYFYQFNGYLGTSVATPVFLQNQFLGVVNIFVRLDNLRRLVEQTKISENSIVFIVSSEGKLIAYPNLIQYNLPSLLDIRHLQQSPAVVESYLLYQKTKQTDFSFQAKRKDYLATYRPLASFGGKTWLTGVVAPVDDFIRDIHQTHIITLIINFGILFFGISAVSILTTRVVRPLKKITKEIVKIKNFELQDTKRIHSRIKEIGYIADALYSMKKGLRTFQRYLPKTLVRQLIETGVDARLGGIKKPLAILFTDINNFTTIAERVNPEFLTLHLCEYFNALSHIIVLNHGTIDKYIGDAIMAFWGAPHPLDDLAIPAARAALQCIKRVDELNKQWQQEGKPVFITRIGLHLGEAIVGNMGSSERINYTIIGHNANIASRLEGINKIYNTSILVSHAVYNQIKHIFVLRMIDWVLIKGKHEPSLIYELMAESKTELTFDLEFYEAVFKNGFMAYTQREWDGAIHAFSHCLQIYPDDQIAPIFIQRCKAFQSQPPPSDWLGFCQT